MATQMQELKEAIESGDSVIEAFENIDLDAMRSEGDSSTADLIERVLADVGTVLETAGVE